MINQLILLVLMGLIIAGIVILLSVIFANKESVKKDDDYSPELLKIIKLRNEINDLRNDNNEVSKAMYEQKVNELQKLLKHIRD